MKIYMVTDLEGSAMVSRFTQTRDVTPEEKRRSMYFLTGEVNACVDGILAFDAAAEVVVWDGHGSGGIDEAAFHPKAKLIARGPIRAPYYLDDSYDALMFVDSTQGWVRAVCCATPIRRRRSNTTGSTVWRWGSSGAAR